MILQDGVEKHKPVFGFSDQVRHKKACTIRRRLGACNFGFIKDGLYSTIKEAKMKALISSAP